MKKRIGFLALGIWSLLPLSGFSEGVTRHWTGLGADAKASTAANWLSDLSDPTSVGAPQAGDAVMFAGDADATSPANKAVTWDLDVTLASWTQNGYTNTITVETCYDGKGSFNVLRVDGDMILRSGKLASPYNWPDGYYENMPPNPSAKNLEKYALRLSVGGNLTVDSGVVIDVSYRGYYGVSPYGGGGGSAASYGGPGGNLIGDGSERVLYGSVTEPTHLGSGGRGLGGGAVHLTVLGATRLDGRVTADAATNAVYAGAGGSVFLKTGTLAGSGRLSADGGYAKGYVDGGGGRIAVVLTGDGADFSQFDIVSQASCVSPGTGSYRGGSGTIYAEKPGDRKDHGWLIMKGNGLPPPYAYCAPRVCWSGYPVCDFDRVTVTNAALVRFPAGTQLVLTNTVASFADAVAANDNGWWFAGGTVLSPTADADWTISGVARVTGSVWPSALDGVLVNADGKLWLDGAAAALPGDVTINGMLQLKNASALTLSGNWTNGGTFTSSELSKVALAGTDDSTVSGDNAFEKLVCQTAGKNILFEAGSTQSVSAELTMCGEKESPLELKRTGASGTWNLTVGANASVLCQGLKVSYSDASSGQAITATLSTSGGGENPGWTFVAEAVNSWTGSVSSDYANPLNWSMGKVPDSTEDVVVDSQNPMTISDTRTIASLTAAGASVITISGDVTISSDLVVTNAAQLVCDRPLTVGGDLWVHDGAVMTHSDNTGSTLVNTLDVRVAGDAHVVAGGKIDVNYKGLSKYGPGRASGSSYGGRSLANVECYGAIFAPTNGGSGGGRDGRAGGTMRLHVTGSFALHGSLLATGEMIGGAFGGTGGDIWVEAGSLAGAGTVQARGMVYSGGGRIAFRLNNPNASFSSFTGSIDANGDRGGPGTVVYQTAGDAEYGGTIVVDNGQNNYGGDCTDLPVPRLSDEAAAFGRGATVRLVIRKGGYVNVTSEMRLGDLSIEQYGKMRLNGHTVRVAAKRPKDWPADGSLPSYVEPGDGGRVLWMKPPFVITIR